MSPRLKAKCPHCQALLNIDRPQEPRIAPCPRCNGDIRIPQDVVSEQASAKPQQFAQIRNLDSPQQSKPETALVGRSVKFAGGVICLLFMLYFFLVRGNGSELAQAMDKVHEINTLEREAQREMDVEELIAIKAKLLSEIESIEGKISRTDTSIQQLLNQADLSSPDIEAAFDGEKR